MSETMMGRPVHRNSPADFERSGPAGELAGSIAEAATPAGSGLFSKIGSEVSRGIKAISGAVGLKQAEKKQPVRGGRDQDQQIDDLIRAKGGKQRYGQ